MLNIITDIKNVLSKEDFEQFDKTFWDFPEETIKTIKEQYKEVLFIHENTPNVCNLNGEDYETPSGVVAVVELKAVISTQKFKVGKTALFAGKILEVTHSDWPSGFCELHIHVGPKDVFGDGGHLYSFFDNGIPGGV